MGKIQDPHSTTGKELLTRADEISHKLKIKQSIVVDLLLRNYGVHKFPKVRFCQHNTNRIPTDSINSYQSALEAVDSVFGKETEIYRILKMTVVFTWRYMPKQQNKM